MYNVSIIGLGFVGSAIYKSFKIKNINVYGYDKFKKSPNSFNECLNTDFIFLCLPTVFNENIKEYDKSSIHDVLQLLSNNNYKGLIIIKSTIEPNTTNNFLKIFPKLKLIHNPEFLTARTAFNDFHNQKHIVIGINNNITNNDINSLKKFYNFYYKNAHISICDSNESESMKIFCNCFYSVKIQFFNELYLLCQKNNTNYNNTIDLMIKNGWINPMHTKVPGPDGQLSYGGYCFPKDTCALLHYMKKLDNPHNILEATINERNLFRNDNLNCL